MFISLPGVVSGINHFFSFFLLCHPLPPGNTSVHGFCLMLFLSGRTAAKSFISHRLKREEFKPASFQSRLRISYIAYH